MHDVKEHSFTVIKCLILKYFAFFIFYTVSSLLTHLLRLYLLWGRCISYL